MKNLISMPLKSKPGSDAGRIRNRGFTLVELLVTLAMSSIVMAAIYSVYTGLTRSYTTQNAFADAQQAVRAAVDIMAEDIMMAGLGDRWLVEEYGATPPQILTAGSQEISFTSDRNMDGELSGNFENITYRLVGRQLQITDALGTEVLIDNVINNDLGVPLFRYFSESPADLANDQDLISHYGYTDPMDASEREDISTVEISVTVEESAGREGMVQRTYTTRVRRRNEIF